MSTNTASNSYRSIVMERLDVDGAVIEYRVQGTGEPVLLIPMSPIADSLGVPLLAQPELASRYQLVHYHPRGYMGSTMGPEPPTVRRHAKDAAALLRHLNAKSAHIVGDSYGGIIALQLAVDAPVLVHSLALLEPSIVIPRGGVSMLYRLLSVLNTFGSGFKPHLMAFLFYRALGPNWRTILDQAVPGSVEQAITDLDTYIKELPSISEWKFESQQAAMICQPVLSVVGVRSQQMMIKGRNLLHAWFPQTEDFDAQSTHLLQMEDPQGVAHGLAEFFARHPIA